MWFEVSWHVAQLDELKPGRATDDGGGARPCRTVQRCSGSLHINTSTTNSSYP